MTKPRRRPPKSRVREKAARGPIPFLARFERAIARYTTEITELPGETARSHRFSQLVGELFADLDFPIITQYLAGLESRIVAQEAERCRVSRGRPDALFGNVMIEFKRPEHLKDAKKKLQSYIAILRRMPDSSETYFVPIASDGVIFQVFAPREGELKSSREIGEEVRLDLVESFDIRKRTPTDFYFWLDRFFSRRVPREPKAENFVQDFGTNSAGFREAGALWTECVDRIRENSDFKVIYDNWRKYLRIAYGTAIGDEDLFLRHTYLATLAKVIAYIRITGEEAPPNELQTQEIVQGTFFEKKGILNFLEEDFFSWVGREPVHAVTQRVVLRLATLLFTYNLRELSEDVMKELYQQLVDPKDRHDLGEYYTPDWLATRMCSEMLSKSGDEAVLDPSCGSGTFLYQVIQHQRKHLPSTRASLEKILGNVIGIDIHPLAVIVSKMNVLLSLGDLFQKRHGKVSIQVYLANSIRHPEKDRFIGPGALPAERVKLNNREILIPDAVLKSAADLDLAVRTSDEFAKAHKDQPSLDAQSFEQYARRQAGELVGRDGVTHMLFDLASALHEFIRKPEDTIWAYILKNQYKPTFLTGKFDVLIGNPPWLSFRYVEKGEYQSYLKRLIVTECGLLEGAGHLITHLELGTLFFVRCSSLYLKPTGKIGFVLPRSIFSADQHDRFRKSAASGSMTLTSVWDLDQVTPLFNVPAAVAFGDRESDARKTLPGRIFAGELARKNASWEEAKETLSIEETQFHVVQQGQRSYLSTSKKRISAQRSYYQPYFKEGATIVPRNFWFVEFKPDARLGIDPEQPLVATDPRAEAEAKETYKGTYFEGRVEAEFLYATLLSTDLLPFGHFDFRPVVLPMREDSQGYGMVNGSEAMRSGYLNLAEWLERAEETWRKRRKEKAKRGDALSWLNYRNKLTDQDPRAKYVVLYPKSATFLCAAAIKSATILKRVGQQEIVLRHFVADHVTYFFETAHQSEARFLVAVLNSPTLDEMIKPMQACGLWGPRDIHKKVWELPIPEFDHESRVHSRLAEMTGECEKKVAKMLSTLREAASIGRARSQAREALKEELGEIDGLVKAILKT